MKRSSFMIFILALAVSQALATDPSVLKFKIGAFSTRSGMPSYKNLGLERSTAVKAGEAAYYIVQFAGPVEDNWRDQVRAKGGRVFDYLPNYAHVVKMTPEQAEQVKQLSQVTFVGYFQPAFRISPDLLEAQTPQSVEEPGRIMLNVLTFEVGDRALVRDRLLSAKSDARFLQEDKEGSIFQISIPAEQATDISKTLANYPEVCWVERYFQPVLHNTWSRWINQSRDTTGMGSSNTSWYAKLRINSADDSLKMPLYAHGLYGQGQIVGVDDTGMDWDNVYFRDPGGLKPIYDKDLDTILDGTNAHRKIVGYNVYADTFDLNSSGHGTHTSGSIAADSMGSTHSGALSDTVLARGMGMAPMARIAFTDIGNNIDAFVLPSNFNNLYCWEYNAGARITSSSWGSPAGEYSGYSVHSRDLDNLAWSHKDLIMFRSAGNDNNGAPADSCNPPATAKNIVCVGANESGFGAGATAWSVTGTTDRNEISDVAEFSSHGPTTEGLRRPHILASGGMYIWSVDSDGSLTSNNSGITYMGGTSMSTPTAAGLCAQLRQYLTEGWYPTGVKTPANAISTPSGSLMKAMMILSTRNSPGAYSTDALNNNGTQNVPSQGQGWGAVVMDDALFFSGDARKLRLQEASFTTTGQTHTYTITTGASTDTMNPFKVVLVYYDYPAAVFTSHILVNNLNLTVTVGDSTYLGSVFGTNGKSATGGTADTLNPEEVVWLLPASAKGSRTATITVTAATINLGPQPYAIVAGGDISSSTGFLGDPLAVHFGGMNLMLGSDGVNLTWRTESEQECLRWEVERSDNPEQGFAQVGKVEGHGTTSEPQNYSYTDNTVTDKGEYYYRLAEVDINGGKTFYGPMSITYGGDVPAAYLLSQSIPNPTRGGVSISYALKKSGPTSLKVYNIAGQVVKTLVSGHCQAGAYTEPWDGRDDKGNMASNGIYLYRLISGDYQATKKLTMLR